MEVPKLEKVVINMRVGDATTDHSLSRQSGGRDHLDLRAEAGHSAGEKKAIAAFKLRRGISDRREVTMRGDRMYICGQALNVVLPRIKDFKGSRKTV